MIDVIDRIFDFGFKVFYGDFETKPFKGRECGEALDPRNLHLRLESSVVDNSSSIPGRCHRVESVITRPPTRLATMPTPSSSPVPPHDLSNLCLNLESSIPSSPKPRSCSSSGYCSDASSIQDEVFSDSDDVDHPDPPSEAKPLAASPKVASKTNITIAMEEAENDTNTKTNEVMPTHDVIDADDREIIQDYREELANMKELLVVSNAEIRRLNAVNDSLQAKELELLERLVAAQETMSALNVSKSQREADSKRRDAFIDVKAKANSIIC